MKRESIRSLKAKAWKLFSQYIRLRDCLITTHTKERGVCITCGFELPFKSLQAGHFVAGRNNSILFDEECTHAQCATCNILKKGNQLVYRRRIIDLYGDGWDEVLEKRSREAKKYTIPELKELIESFKDKIKLLE